MDNSHTLDKTPVEAASMHNAEQPAVTEDTSSEVSRSISSQKHTMNVVHAGGQRTSGEFVDAVRAGGASRRAGVKSNYQKQHPFSSKGKAAADKSFHHVNILGQKIYAPSNTPPEDSMFYILSGSGRKPSDRLWDPRAMKKSQFLSLWHQTVLYQAQKWVDPVVFMGDHGKIKKKLKGNRLMDALRGRVKKTYLPIGTWVDEGGHDILRKSSSKFGLIYKNRHTWAKIHTRTLKKERKRKLPIEYKLPVRNKLCSPLHWSSTPETEPVAANSGARPCFQTSRSASGEPTYNCFWWKKPRFSNEPFSGKTSANNTNPALTMDVTDDALDEAQETSSDDGSIPVDAAEIMGIDTIAVTGNALDHVQGTCSHDNSVPVDTLEKSPTEDLRSSCWDWACPGWTIIADSFLGRVAFRIFKCLSCRFARLIRAMKVDEKRPLLGYLGFLALYLKLECLLLRACKYIDHVRNMLSEYFTG